MRIPISQMAKPEPLQDCRHLLFEVGFRSVAQPQPVGDILENRAVRPDRIGLEHEPQAAPLRGNLESGRRVEYDLPPDFDFTRVGPFPDRPLNEEAWFCRCLMGPAARGSRFRGAQRTRRTVSAPFPAVSQSLPAIRSGIEPYSYTKRNKQNRSN